MCLKALLDIGLPLRGFQRLGLVLSNVQTILGMLETYYGRRQDDSIEVGYFAHLRHGHLVIATFVMQDHKD